MLSDEAVIFKGRGYYIDIAPEVTRLVEGVNGVERLLLLRLNSESSLPWVG